MEAAILEPEIPYGPEVGTMDVAQADTKQEFFILHGRK